MNYNTTTKITEKNATMKTKKVKARDYILASRLDNRVNNLY